MRALLVMALVLAAVPGVARADESDVREAQRLFARGRAAYALHDDERAYDLFRRAFRLSHEPAMLFNMASALERLGRPGEAVESLRAYLRLVPADPDRPSIEGRIAVFAEEQRLLDREKAPPPPPAAVAAPPPVAAVQQPPPPPSAPPRSHALAVGLGIGAGVLALAAGAVALGLYEASSASYTPSSFGTFQATR